MLDYSDAFWAILFITSVSYVVSTSYVARSELQLKPVRSGKLSATPATAHAAKSTEKRAFSLRTAVHVDPGSFHAFQRNYLLVYLLAVAADWLQGPYVYALYTHYGYSKKEVGQLYIAGFASSAFFGTFVASLADKYGRRKNAIVYSVAYILSCATKHSSNFWALLLGRLLGGIAYSILFSAFESWMVFEHNARGFEPSQIGSTFARAQLCNGLVAIVSGKSAGYLADRYGKIMPFDAAIAVLLVLAVLIAATWTENYGDHTKSIQLGFRSALRTLVRDEKIVLLGLIQAGFEGALYTFTFVWTPALQGAHAASGKGGEIPHGTIFATFMAVTMIGSSLFSILEQRFRIQHIMTVTLCAGTIAFLAVEVDSSPSVVYTAFLFFELVCGVYFPGMSTMRAPFLPEESRSSLLTFFRIPLNIIVVVALYEDWPIRAVFRLCAGLLACAAVCQIRLAWLCLSVDEKQNKERSCV